jgi:hypothetical protein
MTSTINRERQSLGHYIRMLIGGVAAVALVVASATVAVAKDAKVKSMSLDTEVPFKKNVVSVESSTGGKWDTILPGQVEFFATMKVDTRWPGYVADAGIFLGTCSGRQCGKNGNPLLFYENVMQRDYVTGKSISFSTAKLQVSGGGLAPAPFGDQILAGCNQGLTDGKATKPRSFDMPMAVSFTVNTGKHVGHVGPAESGDAETVPWGGGDATRHGQIFARVECLVTTKQTTDPDPNRNKPNVSELDLFLATFSGGASSPHAPAAQCKPLKVTTRIATDKAGPVTVRQWRQVNGGPITSDTRRMVATAQGGGKFGNDWVKVDQFTRTTTVQYMDEVVGGTFAPSTPWKSITVHCNGDFATPASDANRDNATAPRGGANEADERRKAEERPARTRG